MQKLLNSIILKNQKYEKHRESAFILARSIQKNSKMTISRLHYEDNQQAEKLLKENKKMLNQLLALLPKTPKLKFEGFMREAFEELTEALLFFNFQTKNSVSLDPTDLKQLSHDSDILIGGLCDFTGELTRKAIRRAKKNNNQEIKKYSLTINQIVEQLLKLNLSGYLRTKFDQAKRNAQKLELILYEQRIRS